MGWGLEMITSHLNQFVIQNKDKWYGTKGHKTCSMCGYNTREFKYHSYIDKDIVMHLRTEHKDEVME